MNETALMVLIAFAIERVTTGVLFLLGFRKSWKDYLFGTPDDRPMEVDRHYKFAYFSLAGVITLIAVLLGPEMRVLKGLGQVAPAVVDIALTWLVLVAGADRISSLIKEPSSHAPETPKPVVVEGTLTLKEEQRRAAPAA